MKINKSNRVKAIDLIQKEEGCTNHEAIGIWLKMPMKTKKRYVAKALLVKIL